MLSESRRPKKEKELAQLFEERRGDMSLWAEKPTRAKVRKGGSVVFSIRFTPDELEMLRRRADVQGITVSELIRQAVLESMAEPPQTILLRGAGIMPSGNSVAVGAQGETIVSILAPPEEPQKTLTTNVI
ncbi:MAG: DUF6290 family protein [Dehalococcoidia bacterium]